MEPGLRLLVQLVIEFAPLIVSLIQKTKETVVNTQEFVPITNGAIPKNSYLAEFEREKIWRQELAVYQRETILEKAKQERETSQKLPEFDKIFANWPLRLSPTQLLEPRHSHSHKPLKIFLAPPQIKFDNFAKDEGEIIEIELILAEGLRSFLNQHYSLHSAVRATEFLAGAWDSKRFHSESSIKALFGMLKTEPILILESEHDGDYLNFRVAYWGLGQDNYYYKTISRLPYKQLLEESAISRALEWKQVRNQLLEFGEELAVINNVGGDNVRNLEIWEKTEKWRSQGIDISKLSGKYQFNYQDIENLCQVLIACHCMVASWMVDVYHLMHHEVSPILPELLPSLCKNKIDLQSVRSLALSYQQLYQEKSDSLPQIAVQLAQSLADLNDRTWAKTQIDYSINTWLQLRQVSPSAALNPLKAMQSVIKAGDEVYIQRLKAYFTAISDTQSLLEVEQLLQAIALLPNQSAPEYATIANTIKGNTAEITSLALTPDGETIVSGCADKTIKLWSLHSGKLIRTLTGNSGPVSSVAVSSQGNFLAVGSCEHPQSNVKVWNYKTGKLLHTLLGHQKPVNLVVISPDGEILASGSNKIKIWDLQKSDRICTLWHSSAVYTAAISPDGTILVSGGADTKIRLWNPRTGEPLQTLVAHKDQVKSLAITTDGTTLLSGSADKTIKIWHLSTGKLLHTFTAHAREVTTLAVSADGRTLFSGSADSTIKIWRLPTGELLQTLTAHSGGVNSLALSTDGQWLVSGSCDQSIKIWRVNNL
ncbi:WD40 repeat domain-containing protein [Fortiea contorta]|uniref:WD40 repeat domain-containing protein n=1 Tax=Fortiea contorta TaxID=1892405 RepID=UPI00034C5DBD|nr:WD40 repeat domain-containing protein [Fortiea contorta]